MSHTKEREEKICLNCGTALTGRFCPVCGQENTEPKETVWALVAHFFNDITHFDGKFFSTVKYLITKPGFLSAEYIKGRRASYLHPIRMYVFTSAFFFIIFFALYNPNELIMDRQDSAQQLKELTDASLSLKEKLPETTDAELKAAMLRSIKNIDARATVLQHTVSAQVRTDSVKLIATGKMLDSAGIKMNNDPQANDKLWDSIASGQKQIRSRNMGFSNAIKYNYRSRIAYDAVQQELPAGKRDGWLVNGLIHKYIIYKTKYKEDKREAGALLIEKLMHTVPQALFISLPVFALILLMLYARRDVYYVDHGIFAIHLYCAVFIILLFYFGIDKIMMQTGWTWLKSLKDILDLAIFFYLYKAMRNFYRQGRSKTILKFLILNICFLVVVMILLFAFTALSVMRFA